MSLWHKTLIVEAKIVQLGVVAGGLAIAVGGVWYMGHSPGSIPSKTEQYRDAPAVPAPVYQPPARQQPEPQRPPAPPAQITPKYEPPPAASRYEPPSRQLDDCIERGGRREGSTCIIEPKPLGEHATPDSHTYRIPQAALTAPIKPEYMGDEEIIKTEFSTHNGWPPWGSPNGGWCGAMYGAGKFKKYRIVNSKNPYPGQPWCTPN